MSAESSFGSLLSVIVPAHDPNPARLRRTLAGLRAQTLPRDRWECVLVDNASRHFPAPADYADACPANLRIVQEPRLGLSHARARGFRECAGAIAVLVDDDNVLAPEYLQRVHEIFEAHPRLGAAGGKSLPGFEIDPPAWAAEFGGLLALRDLGDDPMVAGIEVSRESGLLVYPLFAPLGAGMALRRAAWDAWLAARERDPARFSDRRGSELTSAGDNDIVLCALRAGWEAGYFPQLQLTHLIPPERLRPEYLARLNRGIQKSWMQVLATHGANPWPPLSQASAALRKAKAWFVYRAWSSPQARIRWQGACGHFEGRVAKASW